MSLNPATSKPAFHRWKRRILYPLTAVFVILNVIAWNQAWHFTHFTDSKEKKTPRPEKLSGIQKAGLLFTGVTHPKPAASPLPDGYSKIMVKTQDSIQLECWWQKSTKTLGTVIMFHGYGGTKNFLLREAEAFRQMGYHTLLVDQRGHGGSEGNYTSIGYHEAKDVVAAYDFISRKDKETHIILYGISMGAAAVMRAVSEYKIDPKKVILECPFGSMTDAVASRFRRTKIPAFPMAQLLVFWGGVQNGFWAFGHTPTEYARNLYLPVLLFYGAKDTSVSMEETQEIHDNIPYGIKKLRIFENAGHQLTMGVDPKAWKQEVKNFLESPEIDNYFD